MNIKHVESIEIQDYIRFKYKEYLNLMWPHRKCLYFDVVMGDVWSNDPETYAGGSVATGRASLARHVEGDDPD